jgi:phosphoribosylformimino-5-aminoimidazole carboxamide ribotide isomerase
MIIIPAIDLKDGKCVRLYQGRLADETVYADDSAAVAVKWAAAGSELIHVIDLDGAFNKTPQNLDSIRRIVEAVDVPIQLGGGIRDLETIRMYVQMGVAKIIIGTEAIRHPELVREACKEYPGRIVVAIDAREGYVAIEGWTETTRVTAVDLARQFEDGGVAAINFTDIHRDGTQSGPNIEQTGRLARSISIPVVASGGVSTMEDIRTLLPLESDGVTGVISGKALYTGTLDLETAVAYLRKESAAG